MMMMIIITLNNSDWSTRNKTGPF